MFWDNKTGLCILWHYTNCGCVCIVGVSSCVCLFDMTVDLSVLFSAAISPHLTLLPLIADLHKANCWSAVPCLLTHRHLCIYALGIRSHVTVAVVHRSAVALVCCDKLRVLQTGIVHCLTVV